MPRSGAPLCGDGFEIHDWLHPSLQRKWHTLILGNGASIALSDRFRYTSLHQRALDHGLLGPMSQVFADLDTTDFETVLLACSHAEFVNDALEIPSDKVRRAYDGIRNALIASVNSVHCEHAQVKHRLATIAGFAALFRRVVTFNYDLLIYWAVLTHKDFGGHSLIDCFGRNNHTGRLEFREDWRSLESDGVTSVFYGHGSLFLARHARNGSEWKVEVGAGRDLLSKIGTVWGDTVLPLFVSGGTRKEKEKVIRQSEYLSTVHTEVLREARECVVIFGFSFSSNDAHVMASLRKSEVKTVAVSVFGNDFELCARAKSALPDREVLFFRADSPGCWARFQHPAHLDAQETLASRIERVR